MYIDIDGINTCTINVTLLCSAVLDWEYVISIDCIISTSEYNILDSGKLPVTNITCTDLIHSTKRYHLVVP